MSTVRARLAFALAALIACAALAACGGGSGTASDAAATTSTGAPATSTAASGSTATTEDSGGDENGAEDSGSPESRIAPDAQVTAGLRQLKGVAATVAAAGGGKEARDAVEKVWQPIEGTVKKNEPDLYLDVEDSFQQLSSGDAGDAKQGEQRLGKAIDAYLAKHPG